MWLGRAIREDLGDAVEVWPLYAQLDSASQRRATVRDRRSRKRKVVVATNVAETSLTVPGIRYVVDPGFTRLPLFDVQSGSQLVVTTTASRASSQQRAGRAGRTRAFPKRLQYARDSFFVF